MIKVKPYIVFAVMTPGNPEISKMEKEISKRDVTKIEFPENCIGYRFYDLYIDDNGEEKSKNVSLWTYFGTKKRDGKIQLDNGETICLNENEYAFCRRRL